MQLDRREMSGFHTASTWGSQAVVRKVAIAVRTLRGTQCSKLQYMLKAPVAVNTICYQLK